MSRETIVAKRYGKALLELAREENVIWETEKALRAVSDTIKTDEDIQKFFYAPNISASVKAGVLKQALGAGAPALVVKMLDTLLESGRFGILESILEAYVKEAEALLGEVTAVVKSAKPMSAEELERVAERFGTLLNKKLRIQNQVDASLLGGLQVRIGDRLYDGSLSGKLERLQRTLSSQAI